MPLKGNIKDFHLGEIIKFIGVGKKTGALEINQGPEAAVLYFNNGKLYFVHRNAKPVSITEKILSSGIIPEEDAEKIRSGKVFPPASLALDDSTKSKIAGILREILIEQAAEVFAWGDAEFIFKNGEKRTGEDWGVYLDTEEFLEKVEKHSETLKRFSERAKNFRARLNFNKDIEDESDIVINGKEWKVISNLKPGMTVEQIASASGFSTVTTIAVVNSLIEKGLLTFEETEDLLQDEEKSEENQEMISKAEKSGTISEEAIQEEMQKEKHKPKAEASDESFDEENLIDELAAITGSIETSVDSNSLAKDELERILRTIEEL